MKILSYASTDSYLKWAATQLSKFPNDWSKSIKLVRNPLCPSQNQITNATKETIFKEKKISKSSVFFVALHAIRSEPDYIFLAMPTNLLNLVRWTLERFEKTKNIPIISGFPGIAIGQPETWTVSKGIACDLLIAHSRNEENLFGSRLKSKQIPTKVSLSSFFIRDNHKFDEANSGEKISKFVFAPQPSIPETLKDRKQILDGLIRLAKRFPTSAVVVKMRSNKNESQTHWEEFSFEDMYYSQGHGNELKFEHGTIAESLKSQDSALVTVSSTAAIESLAFGRTTILISDFGISNELGNEVFRDSGLFTLLKDVSPEKRLTPNMDWLDQNYFHPDSSNLLIEDLKTKRPSSRDKLQVSAIFSRELAIEAFRSIVPSRRLQKLITKFKPKPKLGKV